MTRLEQRSRWIWFAQVGEAAQRDNSPSRPSLVSIQAVSLVRACSADSDGSNVREARATVARSAGVKRETVTKVDDWLVAHGLMAHVRTHPGNIVEYQLTNPVAPFGVNRHDPEGDNGVPDARPHDPQGHISPDDPERGNRPDPEGDNSVPVDPPVDPPLDPPLDPERVTTIDHPTTDHAAAAAEHLERHLAYRGPAIHNPGGYRARALPRMTETLAAGGDLEAKWPTTTPTRRPSPAPVPPLPASKPPAYERWDANDPELDPDAAPEARPRASA